MDYHYPFIEFTEHVAALVYVMRYEVVNHHPPCNEFVELGGRKDFDADQMRVLDYLSQYIPDEDERVFKAVRLLMAYDFIWDHIEEFYRYDLVQRMGEGEWRLSDALLFGVHHYFCCTQPSDHIDAQAVASIALASNQKKTGVSNG